jgi:hypothetical protein
MRRRKQNVIAGRLNRKLIYEPVALEDLVGKTVEAVALTTLGGAGGDEPCVLLFFDDGSKHGFVLPTDEET